MIAFKLQLYSVGVGKVGSSTKELKAWGGLNLVGIYVRKVGVVMRRGSAAESRSNLGALKHVVAFLSDRQSRRSG